jgi:SAM-dependent methyltransferase
VRLHLGCGDVELEGFHNLDLRRGHDVRHGLHGWSSHTVRVVYACHLLEHLTYDEGERLLREVHRVLVPGGFVRLGVPDLALFARAYVDRDASFSHGFLDAYAHDDDDAGLSAAERFRGCGAAGALVALVYGWGHRAVYDREMLSRVLVRAGFPAQGVHACRFGESCCQPGWPHDRHYQDHTLFLEAAA